MVIAEMAASKRSALRPRRILSNWTFSYSTSKPALFPISFMRSISKPLGLSLGENSKGG